MNDSDRVPKIDTTMGSDGLLHCTECGEPVETLIKMPNGDTRKVRCICSCAKARNEVENTRIQRQTIERNRNLCFNGSRLSKCTFSTSKANEYLRIGCRYVQNFDKFVRSGTGLVLAGDVGTGKSHLAACIANALIDQGHKVLMTNLSIVANKLFETFNGKSEYIESLNQFSLLILDDFGVERQTEYMQEQVFNVIDARYNSGLPMILTTNLSTEDLKKPIGIEKARIYDRILEKCHPVKFEGASFRRQNILDNFYDIDDILRGK